MAKKSTKTVNHNYNFNTRKHYGFGSLVFDFFMTVITGGFWLIWVAVRYLRTH